MIFEIFYHQLQKIKLFGLLIWAKTNLIKIYLPIDYRTIPQMSSKQLKHRSISRKSFIIKQKSMSSLHSKQYSVAQLNSSKQKVAMTSRPSRLSSKLQESEVMERKNDEITLLKKKLDTAMSMAINEKITASTHRQQVFKDEKTKAWYESKIIELENIILKEREQYKTLNKNKKLIQNKWNQTQAKLKLKQEQCASLMDKIKQVDCLNMQIEHLTLLNKDLQPLKERIKVLQDQVRKQKLIVKDNSKVLKSLQKQKQKLTQQLRLTKPHQQQLKQRIAYLERVNLDLSRKMQDYDRRQNQYIRQANIAKNKIKKLTEEKANLQQKLSDTTKNLADKISQCQTLTIQSEGKSVTITNLQKALQQQKDTVSKLTHDLHATKEFYKKQEQQNIDLQRKNKYLMEHQAQYERVISHFQKVNDEINLTIIARSEQIKKLHSKIQILQKHSSQIEEKYLKFDILFEDRTQKGDNEIIQFFYTHIRQNAKLKLQVADLKAQMAEKVLKYGEERDSWTRKTQIRSGQTPSDQQLFGNLYHQKNEQLILLEGSNDQLLKIKKQLEERIRQLQALLQEEKRQAVALKLKAAEVFRAKKEVQDARKTLERYQTMIEEQSQTNKDLESQLLVLRDKINILNEKNFHLDLQNKNHLVKIKELQDIMTEINADVLIQKKSKNDKNAHMINDSLDKLQSGVKSLQFYFSCSFCGDIPQNPITLSPCGHTFCQQPKCKQAYSEFCFECDTGMPIDNVFINKYMKEATSKYKFFKIVINEATANVKSLLKDI